MSLHNTLLEVIDLYAQHLCTTAAQQRTTHFAKLLFFMHNTCTKLAQHNTPHTPLYASLPLGAGRAYNFWGNFLAENGD